MAKLLVQPGSGEISVGVPIMVTVEDQRDVAAFKDFVAGSAPSSSATEASVPPAVVEEMAAPTVTPVATPTPSSAAVAPAVAEFTAPPPEVSSEMISLGGSPWGKLAAERSPLAKALAAKQQQYIERYGSTGHIPIV